MRIIDKIRIYIAISLLFSLGLVKASQAQEQEYIKVPGIVHIHSNISSGIYSVERIVRLAEDCGIKVVIITDHERMKGEWGFAPLRKIIRKTEEKESILKYGPQNYINAVEQTDQSHPDIVVIHATEASPFYYWTGSPWKENLTMHNWHKSLLVIGLKDALDYRNLPSIANSRSIASPYKWKDLYHLWPVFLFILGIMFCLQREFKYKDFQGRRFDIYPRSGRICGIIIIAISLVFLLNNFPFRDFKYDQYHGDQGVLPYQDLIDYVNSKGGITSWTSPEADYSRKIGNVEFYTPAYLEDLMQTYNYTCFAAIYGDNITATLPGKEWDKILIQYCNGKRHQPVWGIGEIDYHGPGLLEIDAIQTVFMLPRFDKEAVFNAFKSGKMYAMRKSGEFSLVLDRFVITADGLEKIATMGDEIVCNDKPRIQIRVSCSDSAAYEVKIKLIRKGELVRSFDVTTPADIEFADDYYNPGERTYYRLDITTVGSKIISNPIFVSFVPKKD